MSAAPPSSQERFPYRIYLSERMYRMSESDADAWMDFRLVDRREQPEHYVKLAGDALETGDWEVAIGHLLKAIDLRERIRQEQPHDWQLGLTTTRDYLRMASIARSAEDPEYARNLYQTALDYTLQLQEQFPSLNIIREALADCQSGLAEMASESQDQEGVLRHLRNEVEIRRGLATLETPETLLKLAKGLLNLGSVERDNDDLNAALDAFNEGLQQVRIVLPVGGD
ncbi:MAG: hypothetical protein R3301_19930, partial [Saprospiraceae bacterium]|nr:hypothetical protein [Saprospiraceae bacterium]